ncbi:outer membrane beta-barrel protein [Spirosoma sp. BT702]|uniref:Outer membrane beta-barrel protein n=1 Tax=Spirosoma profusum TaxID=2771354 RepID=A0A927ATW9_9BACT|nr:outer membrane beta-barrel protein [Spirosoma profusum]MBD2701307.1 outer membrane beta-barrel protein [Spirosoma profusum]
MKRIHLLFFVLMAFSATAQEYKPFKINFSGGYARPNSSGLSGGGTWSIEPKYGVTDNFDLGLRLEAAYVARGVTYNSTMLSGDVAAIGSTIATATYLFGNGNVRPFIGIGAGGFRVTSGGTITIYENQTPYEAKFVTENKFGGMARIGIKADHFVFGVEYNLVPNTTAKFINSAIDSKNSYFAVKLGFDIGGGRF